MTAVTGATAGHAYGIRACGAQLCSGFCACGCLRDLHAKSPPYAHHPFKALACHSTAACMHLTCAQDFYSKSCWSHHPLPYADFVAAKRAEVKAQEAASKSALRSSAP